MEKHLAYIFDFDGTLVDSMSYWSQKMLEILNREQVTYPEDIIKIITPLGDIGTAKYFKDVLGVKLSIEQILKEMDECALPKYRDEIVLKEGVYDCLNMLKKVGVSLNVLTASPHKLLDPCLKRNGIYDLFDNIWSCDDFNTTKSDVKIYKQVVDKIGVKADEAVFFDDNIKAVKTAAEAGLFTVGVYDESGEDFKEELKEVADLYIESFAKFEGTYLNKNRSEKI